MSLLNDELIETLPKLYDTENQKDPTVKLRFHLPYSQWVWYLIEYDKGTRIAYGYVCGFENELGYFCLEELEQVKGLQGMKVLLDKSFKPKKLSELKKELNH